MSKVVICGLKLQNNVSMTLVTLKVFSRSLDTNIIRTCFHEYYVAFLQIFPSAYRNEENFFTYYDIISSSYYFNERHSYFRLFVHKMDK